MNKVIVILFTVCILLLPGCSRQKAIDKIVDQIVAEANKVCPTAIDEETRLDSITRPENSTIGYYYTLINMEKDSLLFDKDILAQNIIELVKVTPDLEVFRTFNLNFKYTYFDKSGEEAMVLTVTPSDYKE